MLETSIDSEVNYNEGDILTFNCSSNGDPNYSSAYVELIKDFQTLEIIPGPDFRSEYKSNCSVDFNWIAYAQNPLTINQHDVIVRCVVKNSLLNEIRISEKKLNVSAVGKYLDCSVLNAMHEQIISQYTLFDLDNPPLNVY